MRALLLALVACCCFGCASGVKAAHSANEVAFRVGTSLFRKKCLAEVERCRNGKPKKLEECPAVAKCVAAYNAFNSASQTVTRSLLFLSGK